MILDLKIRNDSRNIQKDLKEMRIFTCEQSCKDKALSLVKECFNLSNLEYIIVLQNKYVTEYYHRYRLNKK